MPCTNEPNTLIRCRGHSRPGGGLVICVQIRTTRCCAVVGVCYASMQNAPLVVSGYGAGVVVYASCSRSHLNVRRGTDPGSSPLSSTLIAYSCVAGQSIRRAWFFTGCLLLAQLWRARCCKISRSDGASICEPRPQSARAFNIIIIALYMKSMRS